MGDIHNKEGMDISLFILEDEITTFTKEHYLLIKNRIMTETIVSTEKRIVGKITKLHPKGWGFITSMEIPFTRIFFHWSALIQETIKFPELKRGMEVEFVAREDPEKGYRAFKIDVLDDEDKKNGTAHP